MKFTTYSRLKHLRNCIEDYIRYDYIDSMFNGYIYTKVVQAKFALMNEDEQFVEIHDMIDNKEFELAILTIDNILDEAEV